MKPYFTEGKNNINHMNNMAKETLGSKEFWMPGEVGLIFTPLNRSMTNQEVIKEIKPSDINPGELAWILKNKRGLFKNGYANIFYIFDNNIFKSISVSWHENNGWTLNAYSIDDPHVWNIDCQIVSRKFHVLEDLGDTYQNGSNKTKFGKDMLLSFFCWFGLHTWVIYGNNTRYEQCVCCPKKRPAHWGKKEKTKFW